MQVVLGLGRRELRRDHVEHALVGGDVGVGAGGLEGVAVLLVLAGEGGGGVEHRLGLDLAALGGGHVGGHGGVLDAGGEGGEVAVAGGRLAPGPGHQPAHGHDGGADHQRGAA